MEDWIKIWLGIGIGVVILAFLITCGFVVIDFFTLVGWPAGISLFLFILTGLFGLCVFFEIRELKKLTLFALSFPLCLALFVASIYVVWHVRLPNIEPTLAKAKEFGPDKAGLNLNWWPNLLPKEEEEKISQTINVETAERRKKYHFQAVREFNDSQYQASKVHRTGKLLIVWEDNARPAVAYFTSPILTYNLAEASSIVWIKTNNEKVGKYYIKSDLILKKKVVNSVKVTYTAYVVDINDKKVIAYNKFIGPEPPKDISEREINWFIRV